MKTWIKIVLILFVIGVVAAFLIYKFYINKPHQDIEKSTADYSLTAESFFKEYTANKDSADKKYSGKVIEISGPVSKIETIDTLVVAIFVFRQGDFGDEGVRCTMLHNYDDETKKIAVGTQLRIKGFCSGYNDTDIILEKSSLVKND